MTEYDGKERRRFPRVHQTFSVDVAPSKIRRGQSQNLSQNGLLFTHSDPLDIDTLIEVTLRVPGLTGMIASKARVVRCQQTYTGTDYNIAVQFVNIDEETEAAVKDLLENY